METLISPTVELDRTARAEIMNRLGGWLSQREISQAFAAGRLGLHRGHLSNLIAGKHVASEEVCLAALRLMETGEGSSPRAPITAEVGPASIKQPLRFRRPLCSEAIMATGDIVLAMLRQKPGMTADELVSVTKAVADGFRS